MKDWQLHPLFILLLRKESNPMEKKILFKNHAGCSHRGSAETNLTSIHEDTGLIPGLDQWVKDLALP